MNESYPNISIPGTVISPMTRNSFRSTSFRSFRPRKVKQWRFFNHWWFVLFLLIPNTLTQEMRKIFRDATTELLTRLTRVCVWQDKDFHFQTSFYHHHCQRQHHGQVDLTETLFNDVVPIGLQHLDSYLWAVHHVEQEVADIMMQCKPLSLIGSRSAHFTVFLRVIITFSFRIAPNQKRERRSWSIPGWPSWGKRSG